MTNKENSPKEMGKRLRTLRRQRGWTLAEVSNRTGISVGTLSKFENSQTGLNFTSVNKLATGLQLPITALTDSSPQMTGRRSITKLGGGLIFNSPDVDYEILCNDLSHQNQGYLKATIKCYDEREIKHFRSHPGQEFLYVISGQLKLITEYYEPTMLEPGDSIIFDSSIGHKYVSASKKNAVVLIGMSLSGFSDMTASLSSIVRETA